MAEEPTLVQLAKKILEHARSLELAVSSTPTLQLDTMQSLPEAFQHVRLAAIDDTDRLNDLIRGTFGRESRFSKTWDTNSYINLACWRIVYRLRIAQAVPLDGSVHYQELASKCAVGQAQLERILRYTFTMNLFQEPEPGLVAHTPDSRKLVTDANFFDSLGFEMEELVPSSIGLVEALEKWQGSDDPEHSAWNFHHGTDIGFYQSVMQHPERVRRMGGAMTYWSCGAPEAARSTALQYPWSEVAGGKGTLVDVGGGSGHISIAVAEQHPGIECIVQDLPGASDAGKAALSTHLEDRVKFAIHDYNDPQPVKNADFYLFSMVFHNLPDESVKTVLGKLVPALKPGARVLWCDRVIPRRGEVPECTYREIVAVDLIMMIFSNGKERTVDEEIKVLESADSRFKYNATYELGGGSPFTIVEAIWSL